MHRFNPYLPHRFVATLPPLAKITVRHLRLGTTQREIEQVLTERCCRFKNVYMKRNQAHCQATCQVTFQTAADACAAFTELNMKEIAELADGALHVEISSDGLSGVPAQQYPKIVIRQIRFNTYKSVIERFLCRMGLPPHQVYICRKGEYWEGKKTSCLVTYRTWDEAYRAISEIHGLEVQELSEVPLESEVATGGASREPNQQAPIRA